ncbi:hypothetical protein GYH30_043475 [Glycine max]|uniref:Uncharacterized protein n=1 Tax=Glycine max TaxID=3847 RepID=A0A0R0GEQ6_SOYBN|nr:hypothetical protein GYH30_043475 [Glycine max]
MALSFNTSNSLYDFVVREGNGVKGVADLGLSELPERYIKPPEERMDKQDSRTCDAPPIDLSKLNVPEHEKVVDEIVVNHGVPLELLESLKDAAHTFFNLPPEKKASQNLGLALCLRKWTWEWKDFISKVCRSDEDALQNWPNQCRGIVKILISKLGVSAYGSRIEQILGVKIVNMNNYPPCPNPELTVGVGRHSDLGTITVLLQDGIGDLYVKMEEDNC